VLLVAISTTMESTYIDFENEIENRRDDNVKAKKFSRPNLKSCNFVPKIKLYYFFI
jgi:hypothetical protein